MISKALVAGLVVSLVACAGAPRPPGAPGGPGPTMPEGVYEFDGHVRGLGLVSGRLHVDSAGGVVLSNVSVPCPVTSASHAPVVAISCDVPNVSFLGDDGSGLQRASIVVGVRAVTEAPEPRIIAAQCLSWQTNPEGRPAQCMAGPRGAAGHPTPQRTRFYRGTVEVRVPE